MIPKENYENLLTLATQLGASDTQVIESSEITVENNLANLCNGDPKCEHYGLAPSCPPHVQGPSVFKEWQKKSRHSIITRTDIPLYVMFSDESREVFRLLHEIVAGVELKAIEMGYKSSKAFAGGSCKNIFCHDYTTCGLLSGQKECRNPLYARPSMSGFGINVVKLMKLAGWSEEKANRNKSSNTDSMTWVTGLIMLSM